MQPPAGMSTFEFIIVSSLRAAQLTRGCTPRIDSAHKIIVMAQMEVAERLVERAGDIVVAPDDAV
jgi:DNA-directed RNA polymerase subunit K/omega